MADLPALNAAQLPAPDLGGAAPPRFALLYGSMRAQSFSRLLMEEAARILRHLGGEVRIFDPAGLPMPDTATPDHPKVKELQETLMWSDAQAWCSPENFGSFSAVMKAQLEWALGLGGFQGKPLAVVQVTGAVSSFNTGTMMANVGRWIGMLLTSTQLCVGKVQEEFDANGRMKPSPHYDRLVDMMEELYKVTLALKDRRASLTDRYSARVAK